MLNFLLFLYLGAFKISCSAELSMKKALKPRGLVPIISIHRMITVLQGYRWMLKNSQL